MKFPKKSFWLEHKHCYDEFEVDEWREALRKHLEEIIEKAERYTNMGARLETRYVAQEVLEWLKDGA